MRVSELLGLSSPEHSAFHPDENKTFLNVSGEWAAADAITRSIPRDQGLPLTILTGFLGAGKSTVLNYILKADHGMKIAVLINEFGEVDIDNQLVDTVAEGEEGEAVVLNNGCICCTVSNGFIDAVQKILEQADANDNVPDYFIVETTGLADPKPILDSVVATELREELYIDQVLTVVDASSWDVKHYGSDTAHKQIETADTILLSKTDLCDEEKTKSVINSVLEIRPNARILKSQKGHVPIAALFDLGLSLADKPKGPSAKPKEAEKGGHEKPHDHKHEDNDVHDHKHADGEKCGEDCHGKHEHQHADGKTCGEDCHEKHEHKHADGETCGEGCNHDHDDADKTKQNHLEQEGFTSMSFVSDFMFSLRRFKDEFMDNLPDGVFRSKGLLHFAGYDSRFVFHWSGSRYHVEEDEWPEGSVRKNQLVLIGRDLDKPMLKSMLENCIVRPGEESDVEELEEEDYNEEYEGEDGDPNEDADSLPIDRNHVAANGLETAKVTENLDGKGAEPVAEVPSNEVDTNPAAAN